MWKSRRKTFTSNGGDKFQNLYKNCTEVGSIGRVYGHSKSGWFDMLLFEQWFLDILLPYVTENIQSIVIRFAKNNIHMTAFPSNSIHWM